MTSDRLVIVFREPRRFRLRRDRSNTKLSCISHRSLLGLLYCFTSGALHNLNPHIWVEFFLVFSAADDEDVKSMSVVFSSADEDPMLDGEPEPSAIMTAGVDGARLSS